MIKATKIIVPLNSQKNFKNQLFHSKANGYPLGRAENLLLVILCQLFLTLSKTNFLKIYLSCSTLKQNYYQLLHSLLGSKISNDNKKPPRAFLRGLKKCLQKST